MHVTEGQNYNDETWESKTNEDSEEEKKDESEISDHEEVDITNEGYLMKQSLHLKQFRKRFIILRENHLFCYTNHKKTKITELINLALFEKVQLSEKGIGQLELIPNRNRDLIGGVR